MNASEVSSTGMATDPPVSEKQRRAMWAAAEGHSTLGIPKAVGREFVGGDASRGAGVLLTCGDMGLFLRRSSVGDHAGEWCLPGGGCENDEDPELTARREMAEETGLGNTSVELKPIHQNISEKSNFVTFHADAGGLLEPKLNGEHTAYAWAPLHSPPQPLHPGVQATLDRARDCLLMGRDLNPADWYSLLRTSEGYPALYRFFQSEMQEPEHANDAMAFDRESVRSIDKDGRMHVEMTNISKANVCEYFGREIPKHKELGLDPSKKYKMLRDPVELRKAAGTFNNLPLLDRHVPVTASSFPQDAIIGSTGTDAVFEEPYLKNSLVIWKGDAIIGVEAEMKKELSCGYRYVADMTPGTYQGESYDGVMRNIVGNHVALVREGRAGPDVVVGDSAPPKMKELFQMQTVLSRKATYAQGVIHALLRPVLAQDAKIDLSPVLLDVSSKNFKEKKPGIVEGITKLCEGHLAQNAKLDFLPLALDEIEEAKVEEGADADPNSGLPMGLQEMQKQSMDDEGGSLGEAVETLLRGKIPDELLAQICNLLAQPAASPAGDNDPAIQPDRPGGSLPLSGKDNAVTDPVDKPAMDEAIKSAKSEATKEAVKQQQAIRAAEKAVRPWVGEMDTLALDSADEVYRNALKALGVKNADVIQGLPALQAVLEAQPLPGAKKKDPTLALDEATKHAASYSERFPEAARIGNMG